MGSDFRRPLVGISPSRVAVNCISDNLFITTLVYPNAMGTSCHRSRRKMSEKRIRCTESDSPYGIFTCMESVGAMCKTIAL
jgi:hypothetical protein